MTIETRLEETSESRQPPEQAVDRQRVRLTYEKGEAVKFISHHDEFRLWERVLRRADLPILYKQGFNPQPHMQIAAPLGVGITGVCEFLDITFSPPVPLDELTKRIRAKLPPGVFLHDAVEVPLKATSLQSILIGADYTILIFAEPGEIDPTLIEERITTFLNATEIWRERERKGQKYTYNLRPLAFELRYDGYDAAAEEHRIFLRVQQRPGATGRPDEVVDALGFDDFARTLRRDRLYFSDNAEDNALFATYPVIEQAAISKDDGRASRRKKRRGRERTPAKAPEGRSISERAADEFV
ncbi:MAG: TIGR03936 family radical SAM-associated protein [Caldilineaceae bacterium]|nr:TIGR03936 family radical SAM-associated protein [Caldilineaceae bacterium]